MTTQEPPTGRLPDPTPPAEGQPWQHAQPDGQAHHPRSTADRHPVGAAPYHARTPAPGHPSAEGQQHQPSGLSSYPPAPPAPQHHPGQHQLGPYQHPYGYPVYVVSASTNGMAIASMVLGILWVYWLGSILALVFGYVARHQIRRTGQSGDGMAIAGIVLGWVWLGLLLVVAYLSLFQSSW